MRLKKFVIFSVLCLVHSLIIPSVNAQDNVNAIESMVENVMKKVQKELFESIRTVIVQQNNYVEHNLACGMEFQKLLNAVNAQHEAVMEKFTAHEKQALQMADSIAELHATDKNIQDSQSKLQTMLMNVTNSLQRSESDRDIQLRKINESMQESQSVLKFMLMNVNNSIQGSQYDLQKQLKTYVLEGPSSVITQLAKVKSSLEASQSDLQKELRGKNEDLLTGQSKIQQQLIGIKDDVVTIQTNVLPSSCATVNNNETGAYYLRPIGTTLKPFLVLCDFEDHYSLGGGWTVFQNRFNGSVDFYRNWTMYKDGFGDVNGEHWLGLEKLHAMTRSGKHQLLILLEDFDGNSTYALYRNFKIGSEEEKYKLSVEEYSGSAGDSLKEHNGAKFSTFDQDNDLSTLRASCAESYRGAWWFVKCYWSHLNGPYYHKGNHLRKGVAWHGFGGQDYSLKSTKMLLRSSA